MNTFLSLLIKSLPKHFLAATLHAEYVYLAEYKHLIAGFISANQVSHAAKTGVPPREIFAQFVY